MLMVLIVDDELVMCRGLSNCIDWESYNFTLLGCCYNGKDALEKLEEYRSDIIITDIRMPVMDGLALSKIVNERRLESKVIIISGYDEFDYAKQAISYGVCEYLLKPVENEQLLKVVLKLKDIIEKEKAAKKEKEETENDLNCALRALKERVLKQIVDDNIKSTHEFNAVTSSAHLNLSGPYYVIVAFHICIHNDQDGTGLFATVCSTINEVLNYYNKVEYWTEGSSRVCLIFSLPENIYKIALDISEEVLYYCRERLSFLDLNFAGSISGIYHGYSEIPSAYNEALKTLKYKIVKNTDKLIKPVKLETGNKSIDSSIINLENDLLFQIRCGDIKRAKATLDKIFELEKSYTSSPEYIENKCREFIVLLMRLIEEENLDIQLLLGHDIYGDFIYDFMSIDEVHCWISIVTRQVINNVIETNRRKYSGIIGKIISYIEKNYNDDITLNSMGEKFYINSNYLSQLFKLQTGKNFLDYLTNQRIENAKEFLKKGHIKVYEIAEMVGYKDNHYFSQVFKKCTGLTPSEYRKKIT